MEKRVTNREQGLQRRLTDRRIRPGEAWELDKKVPQVDEQRTLSLKRPPLPSERSNE